MVTKMLGQKTTIWWAKPALWATPPATLSLAAMAAAITANNMINFTPAIETGYTLNPTDSDTDDSKSVASSGNGAVRGAYNFEADLTFYREKDPVTNTTSLFEKAYQLFKTRGTYGYWVQRLGKAQSAALAVGDLLSVYYVASDYPKDVESDSGGPIRLEAKFGQQGWMVQHKAVVA
jgi:hypothetical protein